jgi:sugar-specific transcriptional regulator TrmB
MGPSSASAVAEKSGVNRTLMYDTLARLVSKGFVSAVERDKKKRFEAADPARLTSVFEQREAHLKTQMESFVTTVRSIYAAAPQPNIRVYVGVEGIKNVFIDQLATLKNSKDGMIRAYRPLAKIAHLAPSVVNWWHRKHAERGILLRALFDSSPVAVDRAGFWAAKPLTQVKYLPEPFPASMTWHNYGHKTALMSATPTEMVSIIIESENIAKFFADDFDRTWNSPLATNTPNPNNPSHPTGAPDPLINTSSVRPTPRKGRAKLPT